MNLTPRMTEKTSVQSLANCHTFNVPLGANKPLIIAEVKKVYGVTPIKVRIVKVGRTKKAMIFLKKGDTIKLS